MSPFRLYIVKFPPESINGATQYDVKKGSFLIAINADLTEDEKIRTLKHELSHILLGHIDALDRDLREIENEADRYADLMTEDEFSDLMTYQIGETVVV